MAPPLDYFREVLLRLLARKGVRAVLSVLRRGYYPRGGGCIRLEVWPGELRPLVFAPQAEPHQIVGIAHVSNLPAHIAERMRAAAVAQLAGLRLAAARVELQMLTGQHAIGRGGAIMLLGHNDTSVLGAARVAELGVRAETLGETVGRQLRDDILAGAALDEHAADQILIYAALAQGESTFTARALSSHATTAMWLVKQFMPVRFASEPAGTCMRVCVARQ